MEFANLGKHCTEVTCRQKDFLPFTCKFCQNIYCLDHRAPKDHQCLNEQIGAKKAIVCPMCSKTLKYEFGEDENEIWAKHFSADCPESMSKETKDSKNKKCFLRTCGSKLLPINTFVCSKCGYEFCLKHRYEDCHDCKTNLLNKRENAYFKKNNNIPPKKENIEKKVSPQHIHTTNNNSNNAINPDINNLEFCEVCGKSFHTIDELIRHAENLHISENKSRLIVRSLLSIYMLLFCIGLYVKIRKT